LRSGGFIVINKAAERALTIPVSYEELTDITFFLIPKIRRLKGLKENVLGARRAVYELHLCDGHLLSYFHTG